MRESSRYNVTRDSGRRRRIFVWNIVDDEWQLETPPTPVKYTDVGLSKSHDEMVEIWSDKKE